METVDCWHCRRPAGAENCPQNVTPRVYSNHMEAINQNELNNDSNPAELLLNAFQAEIIAVDNIFSENISELMQSVITEIRLR